MQKILALLLGLLLFFSSACSRRESSAADSGAASQASSAGSLAQGNETDDTQFTDRDLDPSYAESACVHIQLEGDSATADSDSVQISGSTVTITEEGSYILSGSLTDGMVIVDAPDSAKIQLVLDGVEIHSESSAALYILEADKVFLTLADGTENSLSSGESFVAIDENNIDGAIFSKQDLSLNGSGSLAVSSLAGHGIVCKDDLVFTGGSYTITAAAHGLDANDSIRITGESTLQIQAGKDGLHGENEEDSNLGYIYISDGSLDIQAEGDGISSSSWLQISDGSFVILAGGGSTNATQESSQDWGSFPGAMPGGGMDGPGSGMGAGDRLPQDGGQSAPTGGLLPATNTESSDTLVDSATDSSSSMKGLKAGTALYVFQGSLSIDAADDGVHSNGSITIAGGSFSIASGDDAFHADETLCVSGGTIEISESYEGLEALHLDIQGGEIRLVARDDGLNAAGGTDASGSTGGRDGLFGGGMTSAGNGSITISGGELYIQASGDGLDANGSIYITGGYIEVSGPNQGDTSTLDYDSSATISGGSFLGAGAAGMAQTFSSAEQGLISINAGNQTAGSSVTLTDAAGNILLSFTPALDYSVLILSSPDLVSGESYTLTAGSFSSQVEAQ